MSIETLPHYEKVYNFDIEGNENYYVTEDGILVHNGYNLKNKPKNSPTPKKWIAKGGTVEELPDGTWRYTDWEGNVVDYVNGHPVFKEPHVRQSVDIDQQKGNYTSDYTDAANKSKLNPPKLPNDETTWHHHQDGKTMQEVDKKIHDRFTHNGGVSVNKKNKVAFGKK
ncbi:HNH endonuclease [Chryseobacterium sp. DT-3]|uniref:HNH endonuclease n=1 Tax=Chryseobacterium sp. DT-3 TaxID=3396164 RepID=UPI003F1D327B